METDEKRSKRNQMTLTPREKELERLKSLAVVSVLNKNFQGQTSTRPASVYLNLSPSSSLTTNNLEPNRIRSNSSSSKKSCTIDTFYSNRKLSAEKELDEDHLVTNSFIGTEKEELERRLGELELVYAESINDIETLKQQNDHQVELLVLQDKLISQMILELESTEQKPPPQPVSTEVLSQEDLEAMIGELKELRLLKTNYESELSTILTQLQADDEKMRALESIVDQVKKTNSAQTEYIDTKVQTLLTQVLHKNEMINKLQQENELQEKQIQALKEHGSSARSSLTSDHMRRSYISRLKGNSIPPASPPPMLPLPPIPTESTKSDEAAYYKEFTDQLQQRLSMSQEINDLRVWEPSDFDEIQKKIDSETWSIDEEGQHNKAFWKGMKKKLRV